MDREENDPALDLLMEMAATRPPERSSYADSSDEEGETEERKRLRQESDSEGAQAGFKPSDKKGALPLRKRALMREDHENEAASAQRDEPSPAPAESSRGSARGADSGKNAERYCICRSTESSGFMIQCDECEDWFHGKCVKISRTQAKTLTKYKCPLCSPKSADAPRPTDPVSEPPAEASSGDPAKRNVKGKTGTWKRDQVQQSTKSSEKSEKPLPPRGRPGSPQTCQNPICGAFARPGSQYCSESCKKLQSSLNSYGTSDQPKRLDILGLMKRPSANIGFAVATATGISSLSNLATLKPLIPSTAPAIASLPLPRSAIEEKLTAEFKVEDMDDEDLLGRVKDNPSALDSEDLARLEDGYRQRQECEQRLELLQDKGKRLDAAIERASTLLATDSELEDRAGDDDAGSAIVDCSICGQPVASKNFSKHVESCSRKELETLAVTRRKDGDADGELCGHAISKAGKRCMYPKASCPLHSALAVSAGKVMKNQLCGCPLDQTPDDVCMVLRSICMRHSGWESIQRGNLQQEIQHQQDVLSKLTETETRIMKGLRARYLVRLKETMS
eukprot:tig00021357_g20756.t1